VAESLQPDGVYNPDGSTVGKIAPVVREAVLALPNLVKLLFRLMKDSRVPLRAKATVGATFVYFISPIDLIPDIAPVIGQVDDLLLIAFAINRIVKVAGPAVVEEHWDGDQNVLELIQTIIDVASNLIPAPIRKTLNRLTG
jgi:uncharacterized membrane protein YkvA (DUF1232 family)